MINKIFMENIKVLIDQEFKTQINFAEQIGINKATANRIIKRGSADIKTIDLIVNKLPNLNLNWLFYNKGEMWLKEEKKEVKEYEKSESVSHFVEESVNFFEKNKTDSIPIDVFVNHLKSEISVLESYMQSRSANHEHKRCIAMLKRSGFKELKNTSNIRRTNQVHDYQMEEYVITLDGDNCILLESGTGIDQKPLTEENIKKMIRQVKDCIKSK